MSSAIPLPASGTTWTRALCSLAGLFVVCALPAAAAPEGEAAAEDGSILALEPARTVEFTTDEVTWLSLDVSPDGATLVIEVLGDLYLLPISGGTARPLTEGMAFDSQPRFSPDGSRIAFVSDRDGAENLWTIGIDGADAKKLSDNGAMTEFASPAWAPDGSHVIVSRTRWGLRTFEVWAYHIDGGKGLKLTEASSDTPAEQRGNSLGAVYSPDASQLYYAYKTGGFAYNVQLPLWQIVRHDLRTDTRDPITQSQGSAFRPVLSPDGEQLVYGTRYEQETGLRIRHLGTGEDRWLVHPVTHDEQESRFTRDLLPGYAFTPDGGAVLFARDGGIHRVDVATNAVAEVPFEVQVRQGLGAALQFPRRLGVGPVRARLVRDPALSPDGSALAFSAFTRIYVRDAGTGELRTVSPAGAAAFHPAWSPDGRWIAYVSWDPEGGHLWRVRASGRGAPQQLTEVPAFYSDPAYDPSGARLVALRASSYERLYREFDFGAPVGSEVIWLPADGGPGSQVMPSRGFGLPHFGPQRDRIYLYQSGAEDASLVSVRFDGSDRRIELTAKGPGSFMADGDVAADDIRLSADGRHALILHANQLYVAALLNPHLDDVEINLGRPALPLARLTDVGADFFGWGAADEMFWSTGDRVYRRPLDSVDFAAEPEGDDAQDDASGADAQDQQAAAAANDGADDSDAEPTSVPGDAKADGLEAEPLREAHEAVTMTEIAVYRPRHVPEGAIALVGATVLPMDGTRKVIDDGVVVVENDRITHVGSLAATTLPADLEQIDVSGHVIVPGFIDTHAHFRPLRRILDTENWAFLANLAYGVTTGLDVQPGTVDILAYQDLIDAGMMLGPRALSTGPGIFSNNAFKSLRHTRAVLERYRDSYRVHNLKAYLAGDREQRQWIVQAARELELMPTTEGALDMKLDLTHVIDGFSGNEHNFPLLTLHRDVVELVGRSGMSYTPTLLVSYGAPFAESYFYTRESPHGDAKLRRFTPANVIASRTLRGPWFLEEEYAFPELAEQAAKIVRAGGRVGVGSHGQLQGLGYHWELWALARGLSEWETLTAATRHGAEIIGVADDLGTLEPGKLADLVVLAANPLDDIRNTNSVRYVMKNGALYDGDTLDQVHPVARPLPEQWWWHTAPPQSRSQN